MSPCFQTHRILTPVPLVHLARRGMNWLLPLSLATGQDGVKR